MGTILLVDDEPTVLKLCNQILNLGGYTVLKPLVERRRFVFCRRAALCPT